MLLPNIPTETLGGKFFWKMIETFGCPLQKVHPQQKVAKNISK